MCWSYILSVRLLVTADGPASLPPPGESPPNSAEATELLIQFCAIYGLREPDLWPWLERGYMREYVHWVWWVKTSKGLVQDVQLGFRKDTGRFVPDVPDHLGTLRGRGRISANEVIRLGPSRDSALRMLNFCMQDVRGGRDTCLLAVSATASHPWLKYWAGLG